MALTKVSTDGVKDDAITKTKIPANQIEASELADNAVDTNAIANDAINGNKIADGAVGGAAILDNSIGTAKIQDNAVTLAKLPHGDGSSDGKFLRANNGADPSFESIPAGTTINNNADNRVITGSGTANTLNGEANLTYNGSRLLLNSSSISELVQSYSNNNRFKILAGSNFLQMITQNDVSLQFRYATNTGSGSEIARVNANGISFSSSNAAAESLDDYEEGTWTPSDGSGAGISFTNNDTATYTKIGRLVHVQFSLTYGSASGSNPAAIGSLPYNSGVNYGSGIVGWTTRDNPAGVQCHVGSNSVIYLMDNTGASSSGGKHLLNSEMSGIKVIGNATYYTA